MDLIELNDDCLLYLLRYFKLDEVMNLRGVCSRLDSLILQSRTRFANFNFLALPFCETITETKFLEILQFLGPIIKSFDLNALNDSFSNINDESMIFQWIIENCINLETYIHGEIDLIDSTTVEKFTTLVKNLRSLTLMNSSFDDNLGDCFKNSKLEKLKVDGNHKITDNFFKFVSNLKSLTIRHCTTMTSDSYIKVLRNNLKVEKLEILSSRSTTELVDYIIANLYEIEELTFNVVSLNISAFGDLPNLKKLKLTQISNPTFDKHSISLGMEKLFEKLKQKNIIEELETHNLKIHKHLKQISELTNLKKISLEKNYRATDADVVYIQKLVNLESLTIYDLQTTLGVFDLIKSLKKLKIVSLGINEIKIKFLEKLIQTLNQTENRPKVTLYVETIHVGEKSDVLYNLLRYNKHVIEVNYYELNYSSD